MAFAVGEPFLSGTCTLRIQDETHKIVACKLDFSNQRLQCFPEVKQIREFLDGNERYGVQDLRLLTSRGWIRADTVKVAFASHIRPQDWNIYRTPLTALTGINPAYTHISFVINDEIAFTTHIDEEERIFFPGVELVGNVSIDDGVQLFGSKEYVSIVGHLSSGSEDITLALSIAVGAPLHQFAHHEAGKLRLRLNSYGASHFARPIVSTGDLWTDHEQTRTGIKGAFLAGLEYIQTLPQGEKFGMRNAVYSYLQGRVLSSSYELKLLAAFHFLEWFDGTRTISPNALVDKLEITRDEADAICSVRNALVHHQVELGDAIRASLTKIKSVGSHAARTPDGIGEAIAFENYLYTTLGDALLRKIGYSGRTRPYYLF